MKIFITLIYILIASINIFAEETLIRNEPFKVHEIDGLTVYEGRYEIIVTTLNNVVTYDICPPLTSICQLMFLTTHEPVLDGFDGYIENEGHKDEIKEYKTIGVGKYKDNNIPIIDIPGETYIKWGEKRPSRFIGYLRSTAGNRWGGAKMVLINTFTAEVIERELDWGSNKWIN